MGILNSTQIIERLDTLRSERKNWEHHWQELADFILPRKNAIITRRVPGEKVNQFLLDNTALQSNVLLSGFLHGLLTNPNSQFFELTTGFQEIDDRDDVRLWLQSTSKDMLHVLNNSNFQTEIHELYIDMNCFGTACMSIEEDLDTIVRFGSRNIRDCFIDEDNKGRINQLYREIQWNVDQIIAEFGEAVVNKSRSLARAKRGKDNRKFDLIHAVYPRETDPRKQSARPFISQYVLKEDKVVLRRSGFREFPFIVPRWSKNTGEKYGRSPGMNALPEAKTLNLMVETTIKGAQKVIDPPLQAPDDGYIGTIRTRPGAVNFFRAGTPVTDRITPIFNDARIDFGFQSIEEKRQRIREAYFVDQLRLRADGPQMTAREVEQRTEEALRFMGPVLGRQQSELLRPLIDRLFDIMEQRELIEPAPDILKSIGNLDVQYSSVIARAQRQGEAQAILRTVEQINPFVAADPSILDNIDGDKALRVLARINNFPQEILRDEAEVDALRQARAEQEQLALEEELKTNTATNISKVAPGLASIG